MPRWEKRPVAARLLARVTEMGGPSVLGQGWGILAGDGCLQRLPGGLRHLTIWGGSRTVPTIRTCRRNCFISPF